MSVMLFSISRMSAGFVALLVGYASSAAIILQAAEGMQRARIFGKKAEDALEIFPNNEWSEALQDVIEFCINRAS